MLMRRASLLLGGAALSAVTFLAQPASADDSESGSLSCPASQQVVVTERTSAGVTTVMFSGTVRQIRKGDWSTTKHPTGLRSTTWRVTTTGSMDHAVTDASCSR